MSTQPDSAPQSDAGSATRLDRRAFIGIALGLLGVAQAARSAQSPSDAFSSERTGVGDGTAIDAVGVNLEAPPGRRSDAFLAVLSDPRAASWLGQRYLADHPQERDMNRLIEQLAAALSAQQGRVPADGTALGQALIALIQHEYVAAPLQPVDGWLLAPSEARLYALATLAATARRIALPADPRAPWSTTGS